MERVLPIDQARARRWGSLGIHQRISVANELIAATPLEHKLTLVIRNTGDFTPNHIPVLNPLS